MAMSNAEAVKQLRELTGLGLMDCKKMLEAAGGDFEKAKQSALEKGKAKAGKMAGRAASEGCIEIYMHFDGKLAVMVELNCNTDFVARNEDFKALAKGIALHIAALNPECIRREELDQKLVSAIRENLATEVPGNKPKDIIEKIVDGKMQTWFADRVLLDQIYVKDEGGKRTVGQVIEEAKAKMGENVTISRFARFKVGEGAPAEAQAEEG